jgi:hypothetical protein
MTDIAKLDGLFKIVYTDNGIENLVPDVAKLTKMIPFKAADKIGKFYAQPFIMSSEAGFTYAEPDEGIIDINDAIGMYNPCPLLKQFNIA